MPDSIDGDIENAANIKIDNDKKVSWKNRVTPVMLTLEREQLLAVDGQRRLAPHRGEA